MIYRCLYPFLVSFLLFTSLGALYAQNEPKSEGSLNVVSNNLPTKTIQIVDTITTLTNTGDFSIPVVNAHKKDSLIFDLKDESTARTADSLWMKELYDSSRFEEVYGSIVNEAVEPLEYKELPTELLKQRLEELNARTPFNVEYNPSLENIIKHYLKNRRTSMAKLMALSDYYFPMFEQELDRHNLPLEIKYLAVIESALDPVAKSRVGAKGLWQFMFTTGKMFGLEVSSYVDERADPEISTEAAAKYLKSLHKSFNDWDLALAAYNSGPGNVSKAIRRSGGETNYWKIRNRLPRETAGYVPAFLATMYIFEYSKQHGFSSDGPRIPYIATDTIHIKKQIALEHVAHLTDIDLAEVAFLNPQYKLGIIPVVKNQTYTLRLPIDKVGVFVANQDTIYAYAQQAFNKREKPLPELNDLDKKIYYKVQSGDYLGKIANRFGVRISQIKRWNSLKNNNLKVGKRLVIFPRKAPSVATKKQPSKGQNTKTYIVKQGDSLWSIAQQYPGVSVADIKKKNDLKSAKLNPGMELKIL